MAFFDWFIRRKILHQNIDREIELNEQYQKLLRESHIERAKLTKELDRYRFNKERLYPIDELLDVINEFRENLECQIRTMNSVKENKD